MHRLPIIGKDIIIKKPTSNIEMYGLVEIRCSECGRTIRTFRKSVHSAHNIICDVCKHVIKKVDKE